MTAIAVATTCHGRRDITLACLRALAAQRLPDGASLAVFVVEDGGDQPLGDAAEIVCPGVRVERADGTLWWGGAIARALDLAAASRPDFLLWLNDDVELDPDALAKLIAVHANGGGIVVGAVRDPATGGRSYGGQRRTWHPFRFAPVPVGDAPAACDTFQGNVVLVPTEIHRRIGGVDPVFSGTQGGADTDFGLRARAAGIPIRQAPGTLGGCPPNPALVPWRDGRSTLRARLRTILGPRGYPAAWRAFARRHGGASWPVWLSAVYVLATLRAIFAERLPRREGVSNVAMIEGPLPVYRAEQLAPLAEARDLDIVVFAGTPRRGTAGRLASADFPLRVRMGRCLFWPGAHDRIVWTPGCLSVARAGYDAVSMGLHLHDIGIWAILAMRRMTGRPRVALLGHFKLWDGIGWSGWLKCALRRVLARSADSVLAYSDGGANACRRAGIRNDRIFVIRNTIDVERARRARAAVTPHDAMAWRRAIGAGDAPIFLFVGSIYPAKRLDLACAAVASLRQAGQNCLLVAIGDGAARAALAADYPVARGSLFLTPEFDEARLAVAFAAAAAVVVPDAVGLVAVHALAHGVPVIACADGRSHGPEIEYLRDGRNALLAQASTPEALARCMARLLDAPELRERLAASAHADSLDFDVRTMAGNMAAGLRRAMAA